MYTSSTSPNWAKCSRIVSTGTDGSSLPTNTLVVCARSVSRGGRISSLRPSTTCSSSSTAAMALLSAKLTKPKPRDLPSGPVLTVHVVTSPKRSKYSRRAWSVVSHARLLTHMSAPTLSLLGLGADGGGGAVASPDAVPSVSVMDLSTAAASASAASALSAALESPFGPDSSAADFLPSTSSLTAPSASTTT